jgi:putative addiction module component (TIGR02574 family)
MNAADLIAEATSLPLEERARLVDSLLQTLNPVDHSVANAWLTLAQQRLDDLDAGRVAAIPGVAVFEKARQRLGH